MRELAPGGAQARDDLDTTFGDACLDQLVRLAQRLTLTGGSLRRLAPTEAGYVDELQVTDYH